MKKISLIVLIIIFLALVSTANDARVLTGLLTGLPTLNHIMKITLINQMPDPAEPGKYVDLRFKFENNGTKTAENIEAEILTQYPFSLDPGTSPLKSVGSVNAQQKGDRGVIIKFRLRVDKDALEGETEIKLRYREDKGVWITMPDYIISIQPFDAILLLDKVVSNPEVIRPGEKATIDITFKNVAEILLKKIRVKVKFGTAPLAPIGSTNEKVIAKIDKNEESKVRFDFIAEPGARSGIYKLPVEFIYFDNLGNIYNRNSTIGLIIGSEPDLSITLDESDVYQVKKSGDVVVKIVNKGLTDIKFMNIRLMPSDNYIILSNEEVYIGNIDSDDYETADFDLFIEKGKKDNVVLPILIEYKDAINNDFRETIELTLPLYSSSEAKKFGLKKGNGLIGYIILILVVVGGLFAYRKWGKRKKKN